MMVNIDGIISILIDIYPLYNIFIITRNITYKFFIHYNFITISFIIILNDIKVIIVRFHIKKK